MNRVRLWFSRISLVLAAVVLSLLAAEGLIRLFGPTEYAKPMLTFPGVTKRIPLSEIAHFLHSSSDEERSRPGSNVRANLCVKGWYDRPEWDYFDDEDCIEYRSNRHGFRDGDFEVKKPSGEYRILAIGDSFTFGNGVQQGLCWTELLEKRLQERMERPVQVINAGFAGGHMAGQYKDWIESDGLAFEPDVVLIGFCLNDMDIRIPMVAYHLGKPEPLLGGHSKLLYEIQRFFRRLKKFKDESKDYSGLVRSEPETWEENKVGLRALKRILDEKGVRLVIAVFPMLSCLEEDYPYEGLHEMVGIFCHEEGLECVDLKDRFLGLDERKLWVHPTDQHPNHIGHEMMADEIFRYFMETE